MSNEIQTTNNSISPALAQIMSQETPREAIRTRPGRGGRVLLYTDGAYVIRTLNEAFKWNWDFETDHEEILWIGERPFEVRCRGKLIIRAGDTTITKMQYGCQPIEMLKDGSAPVSLGDAFKGAATDALKKCASLLGIALDLYDSDSEINTANPQQVQREIQQAKQQAKAPVIETPPISSQPHVTTLKTDQASKQPAKPFKFPSTAAQDFFVEIESATDSYWQGNGFHFVETMKQLGINWSILNDADKRTNAYAMLTDHARQRR